MLIALQVPASNERGPRYAEQALAAIHQANPDRCSFTLILAHHDAQAGVYVQYPQDLQTVIDRQLTGQYPHAKQERLREDIFGESNEYTTWTAELALTPDIFPLRRYSQFEDMIDRSSSDPLAGLLTAIAPSKQDPLRCRIELHVRPATRWRHCLARRVVDRLAWPFFARHWFFSELYATAAMHRSVLVRVGSWPLLLWVRLWGKAPASLVHTAGTRSHEGEDALKAAADKVGRHLFDVRLRLVVQAPANAEKRAKRKLREIAGAFGQFTSPRLSRFHLRRIRRCNQTHAKPLSNGFLLSDEELATLWHPATQTVRAPTMRTNDSRELSLGLRQPASVWRQSRLAVTRSAGVQILCNPTRKF